MSLEGNLPQEKGTGRTGRSGPSPHMLKGGTFTVSNMASGVELFHAVINNRRRPFGRVLYIATQDGKRFGNRAYPAMGLSLTYHGGGRRAASRSCRMSQGKEKILAQRHKLIALILP